MQLDIVSHRIDATLDFIESRRKILKEMARCLLCISIENHYDNKKTKHLPREWYIHFSEEEKTSKKQLPKLTRVIQQSLNRTINLLNITFDRQKITSRDTSHSPRFLSTPKPYRAGSDVRYNCNKILFNQKEEEYV